MEIEMMVGLIIPDTTALTAFHTLEAMGFINLTRLTREDYYRLSVDARDFGEASKELGKVDILVNANKNTFRTRIAGQPFAEDDGESGEEGIVKVRVLVKDPDGDGDGLLDTLRNRLGLKMVNSIEKGVLWTLHIKGDSGEASCIAGEIAEKLLSNRHYQEFKIMG